MNKKSIYLTFSIAFLLILSITHSNGQNLPLSIEKNNLTAFYGMNQIITSYTPENVTWSNATLFGGGPYISYGGSYTEVVSNEKNVTSLSSPAIVNNVSAFDANKATKADVNFGAVGYATFYLNFSHVTDTPQDALFEVFTCRGDSGTISYKTSAWNHTSSAWVLIDTLDCTNTADPYCGLCSSGINNSRNISINLQEFLSTEPVRVSFWLDSPAASNTDVYELNRLYLTNHSNQPSVVSTLSGRGLGFNGYNYAVSEDGNYTSGNEISIEVFIKPDIVVGTVQRIIYKLNTFHISLTQTLIPYVLIGNASASFHPDDQLYSSEGLDGGEWAHIIAIQDSTNVTKIYVNGVLKNQSNAKVYVYEDGIAKNVTIGASSIPNTYFNGTIDYIRLYNRTLADWEVREHFEQGENYEPRFINVTLIDGRTGEIFNVSNITSAILFFSDNQTFYSFTTNDNTSNVLLINDPNSQMRLELKYPNGDIVNRYIDYNKTSERLRLCANKVDVTHYEQIIISTYGRDVTLVNVFANCIIAQSETRYAYEDKKMVRAYTSDGLYYLFITNAQGEQTFLASLDGSISNFYNIDIIDFNKRTYNLSITTDGVSSSRINNTLYVTYINIDNDSVSTNVEIYRQNETDTLIFNVTNTTNPNLFNIVLDYDSLAINQSDIFRIEVYSTTVSGVIKRQTSYFTGYGPTGRLSAPIAMALGILITLTSLTITSAKLAFGPFGLLGIVSSIIVLALAPLLWYIAFMMALDVVALVFVGIVIWQKNISLLS